MLSSTYSPETNERFALRFESGSVFMFVRSFHIALDTNRARYAYKDFYFHLG